MSEQAQVCIIEYDDKYAVATVQMWRDSKEKAIGVTEAHSFEDHLFFLKEILLKENQIYLAIIEGTEDVVGFIATNGKFVNQLYVHNEFQRLGIGTKLLELAKEISSGILQLYAFEINLGARTFYENHGFQIAGTGNDNEEQLPDILYKWSKSESRAT